MFFLSLPCFLPLILLLLCSVPLLTNGQGFGRVIRDLEDDRVDPLDIVDYVIPVDRSNWTSVLEASIGSDGKPGEEWMIMFYSPHCSTCEEYQRTWRRFATTAHDVLNVKAGKINVAENPDLNGRFVVFDLPSIFHVREGEIRHYDMSRNYEELVAYIEDGMFKEVEPTPWFMRPDTFQMGAVGAVFFSSVQVRNFQLWLSETFGCPIWLAYLLVVLLTIVLGFVIGFVMVVTCDKYYENKPLSPREARQLRNRAMGYTGHNSSEESSDEEESEFMRDLGHAFATKRPAPKPAPEQMRHRKS